jgi:hypothetical protein
VAKETGGDDVTFRVAQLRERLPQVVPHHLAAVQPTTPDLRAQPPPERQKGPTRQQRGQDGQPAQQCVVEPLSGR